ALLLLDLDHFKTSNDQFGHLEGDRALVAFANAIKSQLRASDAVGRLGGEEFAVLLPLTSTGEALEVAQRILDTVQALQLYDEGGRSYGITTSLGLSAYRPFDRSLRDMLDRADQALYQAKRQGRNRIGSSEAAIR
ncbi:MAG: GGDEF domain-containing protein, partial [Acidovorax sp.]|uniref:GGDEF domain-containing protein n=1 Tax=Acidovorax sp. TaxID=1872122 RepID=UPI0025B95FAB